MVEEKKAITDKSRLFAAVNTECHHIRVEPESDEYLQVWIKEPTWLQVEQALSSVMKIDSKTQSFDLDLNKMYSSWLKILLKKQTQFYRLLIYYDLALMLAHN